MFTQLIERPRVLQRIPCSERQREPFQQQPHRNEADKTVPRDGMRHPIAANLDFVDHAAHLAEIVQLGNVAIKANRKIRWNPEKLECTGDADATALLRMPYRAGYSL